MSEQVEFTRHGRNPDILTCIANLSNDEVFTPPEFANRMLNNMEVLWSKANNGEVIWEQSNLTFLDPFTKSGVFLREIATRLIRGLEAEIPDLEKRVDHILTKQIFGIGITNLTALLARRSVYCSKYADGEHSVATSFGDHDGNIWFERTEHAWVGGTEWNYTADEHGNNIKVFTNGKCKHCGASQAAFDRDTQLESHAYAFIHADDPKALVAELFGENMQFDVIIGNPPYQLDDGGYGTSAAPIYQKFVEQAKKLEPRLLTMVIPSRWFTGGKGLDDFRESMLNDKRIRTIDDYLSASEVFPQVGLKGGVCYFSWDRDNPGDCRVSTYYKDEEPSVVTRVLLEEGADVFIRFNQGLSILKKVIEVETGQADSVALPEAKSFMQLVSSLRPFGFRTFFKGKATKASGDVLVYQNGGTGYVARKDITINKQLIDPWKIYVGRAAPGTGNKDTYPHRIISTPFKGVPHSISTETYLCIGPFDSESEVDSALSYMSCRLTRLLILLHKPSADTTRKVYTFVPKQEWNQKWTDEALYKKYGITKDEVAFIESMVRPMDLSGADDSADEDDD